VSNLVCNGIHTAIVGYGILQLHQKYLFYTQRQKRLFTNLPPKTDNLLSSWHVLKKMLTLPNHLWVKSL